MKIKKFNESKSNRLEWLDGETFELQKFTGSIVNAEQITPIGSSTSLVITEFENCIGISPRSWDRYLDSNSWYSFIKTVKLYEIGPEHGGEELQSPDYSFFVFWHGVHDSIGVFDKNANLILVINDMGRIGLKNDTLFFTLGMTGIMNYNLKTKQYELANTAHFDDLVRNTVRYKRQQN